jgi:5-methylcytosine-specific restriction endonuclease McrA
VSKIWSQTQVNRYLVGRRDGWECHYCKCRLTYNNATLDHVVPRSLGGSNAIYNLKLACRHCNQAKANKPPHVFHAMLMQGLVA